MVGEVAGVIIFLVIVGTLVGISINAAVTHYFVGMEFEREIEKYFTFADQSSDAKQKAQYFDQFIDSIEKHELTTGYTSVFWQEQPHAQLDEKYKVAKSLQKRLGELASLSETSEAYQYGMRQVTLQEFCWFPINSFHDAYMINHGAWGAAIKPSEPVNLCITSSSND